MYGRVANRDDGVDPKKAFRIQFPKGCPSCAAPKRFLILREGVKAFRRTKRGTRGYGRGVLAAGSSYFVECEACQEV